jgi:hypothetical protein
VRADEKLAAFVELESLTRAGSADDRGSRLKENSVATLNNTKPMSVTLPHRQADREFHNGGCFIDGSVDPVTGASTAGH